VRLKLVLTAAALNDIEAIGDWIARDNPARAVTFVAELKASCRRILDTPRGYPVVPRHERHGLRR
jgi:toxin ParE1/3/4